MNKFFISLQHNQIQKIRLMNRFIKYFLFSFLFALTLSFFTSCSKNNFAGKHHFGRTVSISPVTPKAYPIRKKYIVNGRRRHILGLDSR